MFGSSLSASHQLVLAVGVVLALFAIGLERTNKLSWALAVLTVSAFVLRLFAATLDPYLNDWDEVFHAVVAKNMIAHPFTPMLHREAAMPASSSWLAAQVWLHKPPFFLWLIAASVKLFGAHAWAVRLPSALFTAVLVPVTWRICCLLGHRRSAFTAALFTAVAYYLHEITAGWLVTDHNDAIFIPLVALTWWAWLEVQEKPGLKWSIVVGLLVSAAVLTKWWVGLCVFLPWAVEVVRTRNRTGQLKWMLLATAIPTLLVGAWMISIHVRFPELAAYESKENWVRFTSAYEGHSGDWTFHFSNIQETVPPISGWLLIPLFCWLVWRTQDPHGRTLLITSFLSIHLLFMLAQTKTPGYTMPLLPFYLIALVHGLHSLLDALPLGVRVARWSVLASIPIAAALLAPGKIIAHHSLSDPPLPSEVWRQQKVAAIAAEDQLGELLDDPDRQVVFNLPDLHHLRCMFRFGFEAWKGLPTPADVARLRAKGYEVFVLQDGTSLDQLPQGVTVITDAMVQFPRYARLDE